MTEEEYILVGNLARMRTVADILRDCTPSKGFSAEQLAALQQITSRVTAGMFEAFELEPDRSEGKEPVECNHFLFNGCPHPQFCKDGCVKDKEPKSEHISVGIDFGSEPGKGYILMKEETSSGVQEIPNTCFGEPLASCTFVVDLELPDTDVPWRIHNGGPDFSLEGYHDVPFELGYTHSYGAFPQLVCISIKGWEHQDVIGCKGKIRVVGHDQTVHEGPVRVGPGPEEDWV